ncbi:MAG: hypothetical protein H0X62_04180, partial [Bacteroidetes bacterium]|nr:hypothetical protein [Bacteroidota bacterium]
MKNLSYIFTISICFLLLGANFNANAQITNSGFENGTLSGWNASSGATASNGFFQNNWSVTPSGSFMARIEPNSNINIGAAEANLG